MATPMNVIFGATKLQMERMRGSSHIYKSLVFDGQAIPGAPTECHAFNNLAEVRKGFAEYVERVRATGLSLDLSFRQHPRCKARKFAGFDKASSAERVEVNPAFEDGTPYLDESIYEVTLPGFDGGTDATDDKVLWIASHDPRAIEQAIADSGAKLCGKVTGSDSGDIDFVLPKDADAFRAKLAA